MSGFPRIIFEYFWLVALAYAVVNSYKASRHARRTWAPEKAAQGNVYLRVLGAASVIPWLIMGVGHISGATPTVLHYFRPQDLNPFVLGWLAYGLVATLCFAGWVFLANGAQKVVEFNLLGLLGQWEMFSPSETLVKFIAGSGIFVFPVWIVVTASMDSPIPS